MTEKSGIEPVQDKEPALSNSKFYASSLSALRAVATEIIDKNLAEAQSNSLDVETTDDLVDLVIALDDFDKFLKKTQTFVGIIQNRVERTVVDRFVELGQDSIKRGGKTVYLARENWPAPRIDNLLPEGVDPKDEKYEVTVAKVREAAKLRLLEALKNSPKFSHVVSENYNMQSLRSALAGKDAERDELDRPVVPGELVDVVELKPQVVLRVRKS